MLRIRLSRVGKKKQPHYRVVVADKEAPRDGRIVERIGHYAPLTDPATWVIEEDRALYWLSVGAQPSDVVRDLLRKQGTLQRLQRLHAGESLEALVAEYKGEEVEEAGVVAAVSEQAEEVVEEIEEVAEGAVSTVSEAAEAVSEAVGETVDEAFEEE